VSEFLSLSNVHISRLRGVLRHHRSGVDIDSIRGQGYVLRVAGKTTQELM
jgi:DNA-binding response OmpR family regulator